MSAEKTVVMESGTENRTLSWGVTPDGKAYVRETSKGDLTEMVFDAVERETTVTFEPTEDYSLADVADTVEGVTGQLVEDILLTLQDAGELITSRSQVYLTGGGLVNMRGGKEYLAEKLDRTVKIPTLRATRLNNHRFSSCLGLMDLALEAIEHEQALEEERRSSGKLGGIRNMFKKHD